ncbi:hypothetical protein [Bradyrhizobium sp. USDA 4486]
MMESMRPCHRKAPRTQPVFLWLSDSKAARIKSMRIAVAPPQLVEEMLEMRRQPRFGADALLEPFTHGIANRAAGAPVNLFAVMGRRANHRAGSVFSR